jgi:hypothetical protein
MIDYYREYSPYTDPGEYIPLYQKLPSSLEGINDIIHPGKAPGKKSCRFIERP